MSAEQPERPRFDRRVFLRAAGGATAGAVASAYLAGPAQAASDAGGAAPDATTPVLTGPVNAGAFTSTGNPVVTSIYTADPDAFVYNGRLYLDTDRDEAPLGFGNFRMREWHLYSTDDLKHWTDHGPRLTLDDIPWANANAWAPQMVERDGKFYWYLPMQQASSGAMTVGVMVGDSPLGPWTDPLGHPLIDGSVANHSGFDIDPTVLVDDDGQAYIYWGSFGSPRAAKLKSNMIEIDALGGPAAGGGAIGPRATGKIGNAVKLSGTSDYVNLPSNITAGLNDFTVATWINPAALTTWTRIFDFGTGTGVYMFLTVSAGAAPRYAITTGGNGREQQLNATSPLATNAWSHVAVTVTGNTGTLYINGNPVATNANMTLHPAALGNTNQNWIGRSQFGDPFLNATIDDFQIYSRGLSAAEVQALAGGAPGTGDVANYKFDEASGATAVDSSGNGRDATIISPVVNVLTPQGLTGYWEAPYLFKRNGLYYLAYARGNPATGGNPASIDYATATAPMGPWTYRGRILDTVTNTTTNHSAIVQFNGQWYIVYHNGALPGGGEFRRSVCIDKVFFNDDGTIQRVVQTLGAAALAPVAWYRFDETSGAAVADATGNGNAATLVGGAARARGVLAGAISLDGQTGYAALPTGLMWSMYDFTIACWVKLNPGTTSPHIWDFGTGTNVYMYLTPNGAGTVRYAITTGGASREQRINGTAPLPTGEWVHVAVTKSALTARLYVNGVQVGQNTNISLYPAPLGNTPNNWIGRSQSPADPFLGGLVDDVRIYQRGLPPSELAGLIVDGQVAGLLDYVSAQPYGAGATNSLTVVLTQAQALLRAGRPADASGVLAGDFPDAVGALRGGALTDAQATDLLTRGAAIVTTIQTSLS
ncbi:hypothetical protein GCM10023322_78610 [Rugosimonospora acidiphila]|uniref:LamG-like jellyroll fold domain-containing protein n=1 Tax=Rugosimonospora acidiphila TaxID=556531 RepID=A0ABP9STT4_9ACTN